MAEQRKTLRQDQGAERSRSIKIRARDKELKG